MRIYHWVMIIYTNALEWQYMQSICAIWRTQSQCGMAFTSPDLSSEMAEFTLKSSPLQKWMALSIFGMQYLYLCSSFQTFIRWMKISNVICMMRYMEQYTTIRQCLKVWWNAGTTTQENHKTNWVFIMHNNYFLKRYWYFNYMCVTVDPSIRY